MPLGKGLGGGEQSCANSPTIKILGLLEHVVGTVQAPVNTPKKRLLGHYRLLAGGVSARLLRNTFPTGSSIICKERSCSAKTAAAATS